MKTYEDLFSISFKKIKKLKNKNYKMKKKSKKVFTGLHPFILGAFSPN
jgi:hypothetical protein